jgi:hypothetical protein
MKRAIYLLCGVGTIAAALTAGYCLRTEPRAPAVASTVATPSASAERGSAVSSASTRYLSSRAESAEITSLRRDVEALRAEVERRDSSDAEGSLDDSRADPPQSARPMPEPEALADAELAWQDDYAEQLDEALAGQSDDPAWAREARATALQTFSGLVASSSVHTPTCGSAMCRLQIDHTDADGHDQLVGQFTSGFVWDAPVVIMPTNGEGPGTVVYLARPGTKLPDPRSRVDDFF